MLWGKERELPVEGVHWLRAYSLWFIFFSFLPRSTLTPFERSRGGRQCIQEPQALWVDKAGEWPLSATGHVFRKRWGQRVHLGWMCEGCLTRQKARDTLTPSQLGGHSAKLWLLEEMIEQSKPWFKWQSSSQTSEGDAGWRRGGALGSHRPGVELRLRPRSCGFGYVTLAKVTISIRLNETTYLTAPILGPGLLLLPNKCSCCFSKKWKSQVPATGCPHLSPCHVAGTVLRLPTSSLDAPEPPKILSPWRCITVTFCVHRTEELAWAQYCILHHSHVFVLSLLGSGGRVYRLLRSQQDKMSPSLRNSGKQSHCLNNLLPVT